MDRKIPFIDQIVKTIVTTVEPIFTEVGKIYKFTEIQLVIQIF